MARSRLSLSRPVPASRTIAMAICATIKPWRKRCAARLAVPPRVSDWIAAARCPCKLNQAIGAASTIPMTIAPATAASASRASNST